MLDNTYPCMYILCCKRYSYDVVQGMGLLEGKIGEHVVGVLSHRQCWRPLWFLEKKHKGISRLDFPQAVRFLKQQGVWKY